MEEKYLNYGRITNIPRKPIEVVKEEVAILRQKNLNLEYKVNKLENLMKDLQERNKEEEIEKVDRAGWYFWPQ